MRKNTIMRLKQLFFTALVAGVAVSCQEEKPQIIIPDPVTPPKEFKYFEAYTNDTLFVDEGKPASIRFSTIPWNLVYRDSIQLAIVDTAGVKYEYASMTAPALQQDSSWVVSINLIYPSKNGDIIRLMVSDQDTVFYSDPMTIHIIPAVVPQTRFVRIASGPVSAFEGNDSATVRIKTVPWNLMDSVESVQVCDTLGYPIDLFKLGSKVFVPADSSWMFKLRFADSSMDEADAAFRLAVNGDTLLSNGFTVKKVSFKMNSIRIIINGSGTDIKASGTVYDYCIPTATDFEQYKKQTVQFRYDGDNIVMNDTLNLGNVNWAQIQIDLSKPAKITLWCYDLHKDYTLKITNTGLPVVRINTNGQYVTRRDTWVDNATMRIELPDGTVDYEGTLSLKGRGNGTWEETAKKPYSLKLAEKAKILGMHKQKRWILLANYKDYTLLRNDICQWVARQTEMPYVVNGEFVELVWNGSHMGNYYLCEQIRIDNHRLDIVNPDLNDPEKGGIFMEIDDFLDYDPGNSSRDDKDKELGFRSVGANKRYDLPYIFKDPNEDENGVPLTKSSATYTYMYDYITKMEDAINSASSTNHNWQKYLDMDRAIDYVLIQELTMNHDSYNTWPNHGPHSAFVYKDSCGLLCFGPCWDFDYHTFTLYEDYQYSQWQKGNQSARLSQWELLKMDNKSNYKYYFSDLAKKDPQFRSRLVERWNQYKYTWKAGFASYVDKQADYIRKSESYNRKLWSSEAKNAQNGDCDLSFQEAVNAIKTAFDKRWTWIDNNITKLGN